MPTEIVVDHSGEKTEVAGFPGSPAGHGPAVGTVGLFMPRCGPTTSRFKNVAVVALLAACFMVPEGKAAPPIQSPPATATIRVAEAESYALLGFQLGMTPDAVIGVAKAAGWKYAVRQGSLPPATAYVDQIVVEAPFQTTVEFSAISGNAVRIAARAKQVEVVKEQDELFQAAVAKWGEPPWPKVSGMPKLFEWPDRNGIHPTYRLSTPSDQTPAYVTLADDPARAASQAFLAGPPKPKSSL